MLQNVYIATAGQGKQGRGEIKNQIQMLIK